MIMSLILIIGCDILQKSVPIVEKKRENPFINDDDNEIITKKIKRASRWGPKEQFAW